MGDCFPPPSLCFQNVQKVRRKNVETYFFYFWNDCLPVFGQKTNIFISWIYFPACISNKCKTSSYNISPPVFLINVKLVLIIFLLFIFHCIKLYYKFCNVVMCCWLQNFNFFLIFSDYILQNILLCVFFTKTKTIFLIIKYYKIS